MQLKISQTHKNPSSTNVKPLGGIPTLFQSLSAYHRDRKPNLSDNTSHNPVWKLMQCASFESKISVEEVVASSSGKEEKKNKNVVLQRQLLVENATARPLIFQVRQPSAHSKTPVSHVTSPFWLFFFSIKIVTWISTAAMTALGSILRQGRRPYMGTLLPRPSSGSSHQSDTDVLRTPKWDKVDKTTSSANIASSCTSISNIITCDADAQKAHKETVDKDFAKASGISLDYTNIFKRAFSMRRCPAELHSHMMEAVTH
ncbi:hypothetical protein OUZ56_007288 [Daphnia magna]|uniref:Uncharacterized protein n=1 Tax=Daphnia magna TaxID=35525 RepID=A0ABQ9YY64_9CRUS|nr:hypothetical protein OUZ56_007288 [Daphnia magna]